MSKRPARLTAAEIAAQLGVDVRTVQRWCARAENPLPHLRVSKPGRRGLAAIEVRRGDLRSWLARQARGE